MQLLRDGKVCDTVTLSAENGWTASFTNLELYDNRDDATANTYSVQETEVDGATLTDGRFVVYGTHTTADGDKEVLGVWTAGYSTENDTITITNVYSRTGSEMSTDAGHFRY